MRASDLSSRRSFLRAAVLGAAGAALVAACGQPAATPTTAPAATATPAGGATPGATAKPAARKGANLSLIASSDSKVWYEYAANQYTEAFSGTVELVTQAYDATHNKIVSAAVGGSTYDVIAVDCIWTAEFVEAGFLAQMDDLVPKSVQETLIPNLLSPWIYKGKLYAAALNYNFKTNHYNKEMLQKGGISAPPKTFEEMLDVSKQLIDKGIAKYAQSWGWTQAEGLTCDWLQLMRAFGGKWYDNSGKWTFNDEGSVKSVQFMVDNLKSKLFDPASPTLTDRTTMNVFAKGDTIFMTNWSFAWGAVNDPSQSQIVGKVGIANNPGTKAAGVESVSTRGGGAFGIGAGSKARDDAWELIGLLTSLTKPENDPAKLKMANMLPIRTSMWSDPQIAKDNPQFADTIKQIPFVENRPSLPWYTEFSKIVQVELTKALAGEKTPKAALDDAVRQAQAKGSAPTA